MKIVTVTLNPAFDMHCYVENFQPFHENLARISACEAGGKGVNISRALTSCGVENTAIVVVGEENGGAFLKNIEADGMRFDAIEVVGRIRENITLHTNDAPETRISFSGFCVDDGLLETVERCILEAATEETILTFTGRNPEGISIDATKKLLGRLKSAGLKIVIDSRSFTKEDLIEASPWLIKPNEEEISAYTDVEVNDIDSAKKAAETLRAKGIENVMISLGARGAVLSTAEGCFFANAPELQPLSTIGAGDSSIGGFCAAVKEGKNYRDALRYAVSYGSAACMTEGTRPPRAEDVSDLLGKVIVEKI